MKLWTVTRTYTNSEFIEVHAETKEEAISNAQEASSDDWGKEELGDTYYKAKVSESDE